MFHQQNINMIIGNSDRQFFVAQTFSLRTHTQIEVKNTIIVGPENIYTFSLEFTAFVVAQFIAPLTSAPEVRQVYRNRIQIEHKAPEGRLTRSRAIHCASDIHNA